MEYRTLGRSGCAGRSPRPCTAHASLGWPHPSPLEQLGTNLRAAELHLSEAETAALDRASDLHAPDYPYGPLGIDQRSRSL